MGLPASVFKPRRGRPRAERQRLQPTPWPDTLVSLAVWRGMVATVRCMRPLHVSEAAMDLRALARSGPLPSRYELADRWGWAGEAGASRVRRLAEDHGSWIDDALIKWNDTGL